VSRVLLYGVSLSVAILSVGMVLLVWRDGGGVPTGPVRLPIHGLGSELVQADPLAILWLGLLVLVLTPLSRVLLSVIAYASQGDRLYFGLTLFVLSVLVGTAIVGVGL
jgi:uncharacterized membrane protein